MGQPDAECDISPAPPDSCAEDSTSTILKRCACKDAKPAASLRKIMSHRKSNNSVQSDLSSWQGSQSEEYGGREDVQVLKKDFPVLNCKHSFKLYYIHFYHNIQMLLFQNFGHNLTIAGPD